MKIKLGVGFIAKKFEQGSVLVCGMKGKGKDLIMGNVIAYRKKQYVSNLDYGGERYEFNYKDIDLGGNTYDTMLATPRYYEYPFPPATDIYLSDVGVYFPAQYCNELNKKYQSIPYFMALSRQVGREARVHANCQNISRIWDKIREQSDTYIRCTHCFYVPKINLVIQRVVLYDKYESAQNRVNPCRIKVPMFGNKDRILNAQIYCDNFYNQHGEVHDYWLIYFNKSNHDTYYFEKLLKEGKKDEKEK